MRRPFLPLLALIRSALPLLALIPAPVVAQSPFDGRYHHDIRQCGRPGTVTISNDATDLYGTCLLTRPTEIRGMQARAFDLVCVNADRMQTDERVILSFDAEGGLLVVRNAGWDSYARCP